MITLIFLWLISAAPKASVLEFSGPQGIEFFGVCATKENGRQEEIKGVTPTKVYLDVNIQKCSIQRKGEKGVLKIRLFHNEKLVTDHSLSSPKAGIELVIPFF